MTPVQGWIIVFLLLVLIGLSVYQLFGNKDTTMSQQQERTPPNQQPETTAALFNTPPLPPPTPPSPSLTETLLKSGALTSMMDMYRYKSEVGHLQKIERDMADITDTIQSKPPL